MSITFLPLVLLTVATRRDPPTEDNADVWMYLIIFAYAQCAQKYAYGTTKTRNKKQLKKRDITHISNRNNSICTNMHMLNRYQSDIDTNTCISAFKTEPRHISFLQNNRIVNWTGYYKYKNKMNDNGEIYRAATPASAHWNISRKENSDKEIIPYKIII